jgi:hypothetical protein
MSKRLNKIGYKAELIYNGEWKVVVKYNSRKQYFYIFNTEQQAIDVFNKLV